MIKNRTPYLGKIYLTFEKDPHYTGKSTLNAIHLDLGFTKLVSRIVPNSTKSGKEVDPKKIEKIELLTGGKIGDFQLDGFTGPDYTLPNSFLSEDGKCVGSIRDAWFYVENRLIVCPTNPTGVAIKLKKDFYLKKKRKKFINSYSDEFIEGFYGYSHRSGALFKKGDKIFDPDYLPIKGDFSIRDWSNYQKRLQESVKEQIRKYGNIQLRSLKNVVPFNRRGRVVIETWDQAEQAALNLSKYLS